MPQPAPASFHEGCYCFRDAEADAARASGQLVRCGGGQPCNCGDPLASEDALWDTIVGDVVPRGAKRPRSQCASCSCACAILHAASAAATAAAAKIRRCCGGDCRCPAGMCRCPQEAVPMDTYACGALNDTITQRVASLLQMEPPPQPQLQPLPPPPPPPPPDLSAALQVLQTPTSMTGAEIANALQVALQGFPAISNMQQTQPAPHIQPVQTARTGCCTTTDYPVQRQQQLSDELANGIQPIQPLQPPQPIQPTQRACCGGASVKPPEPIAVPPATDAITTADLAPPVQALPPLTTGRQGCCGGSSASALLQSTAISEVLATAQHGDESSRLSAKTLPPATSPSFSTRAAKSFPDSAPSTRSDSSQKSGERDRAFQCNLCGAAFKFKQNRDRHVNEVHHGLRPHECDYPRCNRAFKNLSGLKQHKKTVHEKARPFKCLQCDRAFGQRNHLSQHVLVVHEKVKRYPCNFCDMAFSNVGNRTQHTKRRHPQELQRKENEPRQLNESTT